MRRETITFRINPDAEPVPRPAPRVVVVNGTRYTLDSPAPVVEQPIVADVPTESPSWPDYPSTD